MMLDGRCYNVVLSFGRRNNIQTLTWVAVFNLLNVLLNST